jgi:hypothetical protein
MVYYHGEINTPVERHIDIYIADTDYNYAEWKVWDEAVAYAARFIEDVEVDYDEREFIDESEGWIIAQITEQEYEEAMRDGEWCV